MIYNTVRDNKYLESAIGVFDSRYETAGQAIEEPENKNKHYRPPKNKAVLQTDKQPVEEVLVQCADGKDIETLTQKVAEYMLQNNITDLEEFLSKVSNKSNMEM